MLLTISSTVVTSPRLPAKTSKSQRKTLRREHRRDVLPRHLLLARLMSAASSVCKSSQPASGRASSAESLPSMATTRWRGPAAVRTYSHNDQ